MTRTDFLVFMLYALSLQWHWVPNLNGVPVPAHLGATIFASLWLIAAIYSYRQELKARLLLAACAVLYVVDVCVQIGVHIADIGSHSRDVPLEWQMLFGLFQTAIFVSALALPIALRKVRGI